MVFLSIFGVDSFTMLVLFVAFMESFENMLRTYCDFLSQSCSTCFFGIYGMRC